MGLIVLFLLIALTFYSFYGLYGGLNVHIRKLMWIYGVFAGFLLVGVWAMVQRQITNYSNVSIFANVLMSIAMALIFFLFFSFIVFIADDFKRVFQWIFISIARKRFRPYPSRSRFIAILSLALGSFIFVLVMYGTLFGYTHYKVHRVEFAHENIPSSFNGFTIAQISDLHLGTFGSKRQVEKGLEMLMDEEFDMLVFTGDMVNDISSEALPYIDLLKMPDAEYGKFAILGNHDYAEYPGNMTQKERENDVIKLRQYISEMGFTLLENSNRTIFRGDDSIFVAGVENWGIAPFPQYGDLDKALSGINADGFILLLSHDPSHWTEIVTRHPVQVELTLSGHTHGMQFGFELGSFKWSPVQYRYRNWAGMFEHQKRALYVNRGFGGIGYPGRVGIRPEITIIELKTLED